MASTPSDFDLISQEESPEAILGETLESVKGYVTSIIREIDKQERPTREVQVKIWKYLDLLWTGIANFYWNSTSNQWKPITYDDVRHLSESSDIDPTLLNKTINMLRPYGESIIGVLTTALPRVKYYPANADSIDDINTAKAYINIEQKIVIDNRMKTKMVQMLVNLLTGGFFAAYNYSHSNEKYGTVSQDTFETQKFRITTAVCPSCGFELSVDKKRADTLDNAADTHAGLDETINIPLDHEQERAEIPALESKSQELIEDELQPQPEPLAECPNCQEQVLPQEEFEEVEEQVQTGTLIIPKSRQIIEIFGPMEVKIPTHASKKEQVHWCILEQELHESDARTLYPKYKDKIRPGSHTDLAYDRWARSQYENMGELNQYYVTIRKLWLRPSAYEILGDEESPEKLKTLFPSGLMAVFANETLLFIEESDMDDHWTFSLNPIYRRIYGDPLLKAAIPLQESANDLFQLELETVRYAIPQAFADPDHFDFEQYSQSKAQPGLIYPLKKPAQGSLSDVIASTTTANLPKEVDVLEQKIEKLFQFILGTFPSIFGGEGGGGKTLGEYQESRGQALQRLNVNPKEVIDAAYAEMMAKTIKHYADDLLEDENFVISKGNSFINVWIKKADLQGRVGEVRPEISEQFPSSWGQKKAAWLELVGLNNEIVTGVLFHPENIGFLKEVIGMDDLYVPGDDQRNKQLEEIRNLILTEPSMPPVDEMGEPLMDEMGAPISPTSSVQIEPVDDDNIHIQTLSAFICSQVGQGLKETNPPAYMNLLLHLQEHQMRLQEQMMIAQTQMQEQEQEQKVGEANV
jgi:hypothetical protein